MIHIPPIIKEYIKPASDPFGRLTSLDFLNFFVHNRKLYESLPVYLQSLLEQYAKELYEYEQSHAGDYFYPHEGQLEYLLAIEKAKILWLFWANSEGKTEVLMFRASTFARLKKNEPPPPWFYFPKNYPVFPPYRIYLFTSSYDNGAPTLNMKLNKFIPEDEIEKRIPYEKNIKITREYILKNGSQIKIMTYSQSGQAVEGWECDIAMFDEIPPESFYSAVWRGVMKTKKGGSIHGAVTPLKGTKWLRRRIWNRRLEDHIFARKSGIKHNIGVGITKKEVDNFKKEVSAREYATRVQGEFYDYVGKVFDFFNIDKHVVEKEKIEKIHDLDPSFSLISIDPHEAEPHRALKVEFYPAVSEIKRQVRDDPQRVRIVYVAKEVRVKGDARTLVDAVYNSGMIDDSVIAWIFDQEAYYKGKDQFGRESAFVDQIKNISITEGLGIFVAPMPKKPRISTRVVEINAYLKADALFIHPKCEECQIEIEDYSYDENYVYDKTCDDHMIQCLGRALLYPVNDLIKMILPMKKMLEEG